MTRNPKLAPLSARLNNHQKEKRNARMAQKIKSRTDLGNSIAITQGMLVEVARITNKRIKRAYWVGGGVTTLFTLLEIARYMGWF